MVYQKWVGKDYYNPFIKDFIELEEPLKGMLYVAGDFHVTKAMSTNSCTIR